MALLPSSENDGFGTTATDAHAALALLPRGDHDGHYAYIGIFYTRRMLVQFKFRRLFSTPYYCLLIERTHEGGLA